MKSDRRVSYFDVDNTLLDTDRAIRDLKANIEAEVGQRQSLIFWSCYESVRRAVGTVNLTKTLEQFSVEVGHGAHQRVSDLIWNIPQEDYVFEGATEALDYMRGLGKVVLLTDGEQEFQELKILRSGLNLRVDDYIVTPNKIEMFAELAKQSAADEIVIVDDKPTVIDAANQLIRAGRLTTIWIARGKYANDATLNGRPDATITLHSIGQLVDQYTA